MMRQAVALQASAGGSTAAYHQLTQRVRAPTNGLAVRMQRKLRVFAAEKCIHTRLSATVSLQLATVAPPSLLFLALQQYASLPATALA